MRKYLSLCTLLLLAPLFAPPALADTSAEVFEFRYVATPNHMSRAVTFGEMCTSSELSEVVVGGVCSLILPGDGLRVTIEVTDDLLGPAPFRWDGFTGSYPHVTCRLAGSGYGATTIQLDPGCSELSIFVGGYSTTGTIRVTFA